MLYAILCYDSEQVITGWSKEQDDAVLADLRKVEDRLAAQNRLGPVARLMPTSTAKSLRKGQGTMVLDGPFAETKEQLLGFFVVECESMDQAVETAKDFSAASGSKGVYEVRPLAIFRPGPPGSPAA